jgi:hypothetical protein
MCDAAGAAAGAASDVWCGKSECRKLLRYPAKFTGYGAAAPWKGRCAGEG